MSTLIQYASSAGSGKTFTLVNEYLKIVLDEPYHFRNVLAVTFTNKATEEMKRRIIEALSLLAFDPPQKRGASPVYASMAAHFRTRMIEDPSFTLEKQARRALHLILSDYSNFSVSTIESFFQRVIRSFTRELNLSYGYEVEMQRELTLDELIRELFREVGENKALTRTLKRMVTRRLDEKNSWNVERDLKKLGNELFQETFQQFHHRETPDEDEDIFAKIEALEKQLYAIRQNFVTRQEELARAALDLIRNHNLTIEDFSNKYSGVAGHFLKILNKSEYEPGKRVVNLCESDVNDLSQWATKSSKRKSEINAVLEDGLGSFLEKIYTHFQQKYTDYLTANEILKNLDVYGLIRELERMLEAFRREHNLLLISDTNVLLNQVVTDRDTPFIYEKIGTRYNHYLIDEFQDTSRLQWKNLAPLVRESLATGHHSLIVGDAKQSVYRWRNGDMRLLLGEAAQDVIAAGFKVQGEVLDTNYRTAASVVNFNNQFFGQAASLMAEAASEAYEFIVKSAYTQVAQKIHHTDYPGWVQLQFFEDGKEGEKSWKEQALAATLRTIDELRAEGASLSDIALLTRTNNEGIELAEALQEAGIRVTSADSLKLQNHPIVRLLVSLLAWLHNEDDAVAEAQVNYYSYLCKNLPQTSAADLAAGNALEGVPPDVFTECALPPALLAARTELRQLPVYECVERLLRFLPEARQADAYVQGFLNLAHEYCKKDAPSLRGFLSFWEEEKGKRAISAGASADAVQILTIHKAKGLEFSVVMVPYADWKFAGKSNDILWAEPEVEPYNAFDLLPVSYKKDLAQTHFAAVYEAEREMIRLDKLNVLYVAFTRPKHRLYVFSKYEKSNEKKDSKSDEPGPKSISELLKEVLDSGQISGKWSKDLPGGAAISFETGVRSPIPHTLAPTQDNTLPHPPTPARWAEIVKVRRQGSALLSSGFAEFEAKRTRGNVLHEALRFVRTPEDIHNAVQRIALRGLIPADETEQLARQLSWTIEQPSVHNYFSDEWQIRTEAELVAEDGRVLRPDRVNLRDQTAVVIDYKTGRAFGSHEYQVYDYIEALRQMGYTDVRGYLYYLFPRQFVRVGKDE